MTSFVDASVLVAIIADEADAWEQAERLRHAKDVITSPTAIWEAVVALSRSHSFDPEDARDEVEGVLHLISAVVVPIDARVGQIALEAYIRYGKGRHPARLNMGDCFAYACAKTNDATLLYKGDDFSRTDLA
ncbi:ribonuclease VapC [Sphingomonas guangdongensis]|uniref:Ribonuclease VapC n=1 Tax=Sphingomonas guangdongensis TaxID=1141890 RepID=A0A285QGM1_9SPHN|nr:type II toxin-antitoxin system VapC family toxin [Sphingomonas guangdongensis]SOB80624.1 ribonuclease VapC [Sphingomonas guangdongensis]